jgi:multiple sugar transport system permease protein
MEVGKVESKEAKNKRRNRREKSDNLVAYGFISPWILGVVLFSGVPIIASFVLSFTKWNLISPPKFIGLDNYKVMFHTGSSFWNTLHVTLIFTVFSVCITVTWALFLALILNFKLEGMGIFQFFYFIPAVLPSVAIAFVFQLMFNKEIGIFSYILNFFGIMNTPNWLTDTHWVIPSIIFVSIFTYTTGQMMLIFSSSLKEVPRELYEACEIDGANSIQKFFYVTLPGISSVLLFNVVIATVGSLNNSFSLIYPLTAGGPNNASNVLGLDIYHNAFENFKMGYASALAIILFLIVAIISWVQFTISKKWVYYEN